MVSGFAGSLDFGTKLKSGIESGNYAWRNIPLFSCMYTQGDKWADAAQENQDNWDASHPRKTYPNATVSKGSLRQMAKQSIASRNSKIDKEAVKGSLHAIQKLKMKGKKLKDGRYYIRNVAADGYLWCGNPKSAESGYRYVWIRDGRKSKDSPYQWDITSCSDGSYYIRNVGKVRGGYLMPHEHERDGFTPLDHYVMVQPQNKHACNWRIFENGMIFGQSG